MDAQALSAGNVTASKCRLGGHCSNMTLIRIELLRGRNLTKCSSRPLSTGQQKRRISVTCNSSQKLQNPFQAERELDGLSKALVDIQQPLLYAGAAVFLAATAFLGSLVGTKAPESARRAGRMAGAAVGVVVSTAMVTKLQRKRLDAGAVLLHNALVGRDDPTSLKREEVVEIGNRVGGDLSVKLVDELKRIYDTYLESVVPPGEEPLKGNEADSIRAFKEALGLSDEDAAPAHIDVGRRIMRSRFEASTRAGNTDSFRALQKLIYVSDLVFGVQKAAFLLPWRRIFNLSDSQLSVAKRENAKALFRGHIESKGGMLQANRAALAELKAFQQKVRLEDEVASEAIKEASRAFVEDVLEKGIASTKKRLRERDYTEAVKAVKEAVSYSRALGSLANDPTLPAGLGPVSVFGGRLQTEGRDLRELFRIYVEESLRTNDSFTDQLEDDVADMQTIMGMGAREAADIRSEIVSKNYKRLLREQFKNGRLDAATSKAEILEELCDKLNFDPDSAAALHKQLYRERLTSVVADKKISEEDANELDRLRRLLCLPRKEVDKVNKEICGRIYQDAVEDAMKAGIDRFGFRERENVERVKKELRLDTSLAKSILDDVARRAFMAFVSRSRTKSNRLDAAKELKGLVFFSNIVVAPLLEDVDKEVTQAKAKKAAEAEEQQKKIADMMVEAQKKMEAEKKAAEELEEAAEEVEKVEEAAAISSYQKQTKATAEPVKKPAADASSSEPSKADKMEAEKKAAEEVEEAAAISSYQKQAKTTTEPVKKPARDASSSKPPKADKAIAGGTEEVTPVQPKAESKPEATSDEDVVSTLKKSQTAATEREAGEQVGSTGVTMRSQKEITLAKDLDAKDRLDIYRNFLLYCMSGDVVALPMGSTVVVERDSSEFARLSQLGDILGLNPMEINSVHTGLAEQAYRSQVQQALGSGIMSKEKADHLSEVRDKMGLSKEAAEKIIKGVQNQHLIGNLNAAKASGNLDIEKLLDMKEAGIEVESFVSEEMRLQMYTKEVASALSSGTGDFDEERILKELPKQLSLPERRVKSVINGQASDRKRDVLVQAVSMLRQRKLDEVVKCLNNLLACNKALPDGKTAQWREREEVQDLYSVYAGRQQDAAKRGDLCKILGIAESEAQSLEQLVQSGQFKLEQDVEEEAFF